MTNTPKVFGKEMTRMHIASDDTWYRLDYGLLALRFAEHSDGTFSCGLGLRWGIPPNIAFRDADKSKAIVWLESEARRIMCECFEIAWPLEAVVSESLHGRAPVRLLGD